MSDQSLQGKELQQFRKEIVQSWDRIFQLEKEDDGWLYGKKESKSIQATFWELRTEKVVKAEVFTAK